MNPVARQALEQERIKVKHTLRFRENELHTARIHWLNLKEGVRDLQKRARKLDEALS